MKLHISSTARLSFPLASAIAALLAAPSVEADQIWDGGGADNNWNTAANWGSNTLPTFTNAITFTGNTRNGPVNNLAAASTIGGINLTNDGSSGKINAFTLSGNSITLGGDITTTANTTGATITDTISLDMILNANRTITTNQQSASVQHNLTVSGIISESGTRGLIKAGGGLLTLTGANTYTGTTTINAGTLDLGGGTANGSLSSATLTLGGGAFSYTRTGATTQGFTSTNINSGRSAQISVVSGNILELGTVARGVGGALDFSTTGAGTVAALAASNVGGIMGGLAFGDSWAVANGAGIAINGLGSYTLTSGASTTAANYTGFNIDVDNSPGTLDAAITANSLRFSSAAATTLSLTGTTNVITTGGILVGGGVGGNLSTITGGTLAGANTKDLAIIQNNTSGGLTISSIIGNNTGATALTKSGGGLLTLDGNNTFTGGVFIHAGRVALGHAGALNSTTPNNVTFGPGSTGTLGLGGNNLTIPVLNTTSGNSGTAVIENANAANATLTISSAGNSTFAGVIQDGAGSGTLALTKSLSGTLTLSGANTYSGGTTLTEGVVAISNATSFGTGSVLVTGSSRINATAGLTYANAINVGAALTMQNPATATSTATFSGVLSGAGNISLPNSGTNGQQGIIAFTNTANSFTGNVVLSASGSGDEHFQFNSIGDGGNFTFAKNGNRQLITHAGSSNITFETRQINIASTMTNITTRQGMDGGGGSPVSSFFTSGAGTVTFNANMGMTSLASDGVFYFNGTNTGNNTFAGTIGDPTGAGKLWIGKLGAGTWLLTADNTYEGGTIVANGVLSVSKIENAANAQPLGKGSIIQFGVGNNGTSGSLVFSGSTDSTTDKQVVVGPLNQANGLGVGGIINNGSGTLTFSNASFNPTISGNVVSGITTNAVTVARTLTLGGSNTGANTISGTIQNNNGATGTVGLAKVDPGSWTLSAANTYTGATSISGGTLVAAHVSALTTSSTVGISSSTGSGTLRLATDTTVDPYVISSSSLNPGTVVSDRATTGAGITHVLGAASMANNTYNFQAGGNVTSGTAGVSVASVNLTGGNAGTSTLNPTTANLTVVGGASIGTNNFAKTLNLGGTSTGNAINGVISNGLNTLSLTKSDISKWTLSGTNTYTGATTISGGTLLVNSPGSLAAGSAVAVDAGTLGGSGTIGGTVTVAADGSLAPGASAGTLTISGGLNVSAPANGGAGKLNFELDALAGTNDRIAVAGTLTIGVGVLGFNDFVFTNLGGLQVGTYTLITSGGIAALNTLDAANLTGTLPGGLNGALAISGNNIVLNVTSGGTTYASWIATYPGVGLLTGVTDDPDNDGIDNGAEMVLGGNPATGMDTALLPTIELVNADPDGNTVFTDYLLFTYRRSDLSVASSVTADCETDTDLAGTWTAATGAPGVVILVDNNFTFTPPAAADTDRVRVYVPRLANTKLFGRLKVIVP